MADLIGRHRNTIKNWEAGLTTPKDFDEVILSEKAGISIDWLHTGREPVFSFDSRLDTLRKKVSEIVTRNKEPELYIWGRIGAGDAFDIHMQETDPEHMKPMEIMKVSTLFEHKIKDCFRVDGDSMYPLVRRGALVGVDFKNKRIINGGLYALNLPAEGLVVKEVHPEGKKLKLHSYNERIKDYYLHEGEWEEYVIAGRIAWLWQDTNKT